MAQARETFEAYFDSMLGPTCRVANRVLRNREDAEDVAAEALARAYLSWDTLASSPHRKAWALRVATNLAIDMVRRRARRRGRVVQLVGTTVNDPTDRIALLTAIGSLSRRQREAIVLRYFVGLTESDAAAMLGISVGAIKAHHSRAMSNLRTRLDPLEEARVVEAMNAMDT